MSIEPNFIIGDARLYLGDAADILPQLGCIDECVSDPPYLIETSGGGAFRKRRKNMDAIAEHGLDKGFDLKLIKASQFKSVRLFCHMDQLPDLLVHLKGLDLSHLRDDMAEELLRLMPELKGQYARFAELRWRKLNSMPVANKHYRPDNEVWVHAWGTEEDPTIGHPVGKVYQLAREYTALTGKQDVYDHPTVKPIDLMRFIMWTVQGETVCDPFMGTGTTGAAALIHRKKFIGIEKNPRFFGMAVKRITALYRDGLVKWPEVAA